MRFAGDHRHVPHFPEVLLWEIGPGNCLIHNIIAFRCSAKNGLNFSLQVSWGIEVMNT